MLLKERVPCSFIHDSVISSSWFGLFRAELLGKRPESSLSEHRYPGILW
jgi:hypothetical protein